VTAQGISAKPPVELFKIPADLTLGGLHPDGRRLVAARLGPPQFRGDRVVEILNWFDQVQAKDSGH
jgi:hypothetical protein